MILDVGLTDILDRPAWQRDAACKEHPHVDFFPERGKPATEAKLVCRGCLVQADCLAYAVASGPLGGFGVWGGLSAQERKRLRRAA